MAGAETRAAGGDIAIIGMACVFPGADGPEAFWRNICAGEDQIGEPSAEWGAARYLNGIGPTRITTAPSCTRILRTNSTMRPSRENSSSSMM